jgi:uncharacterized protein YjbI with pentapeptide repeats
MEDAMPSSRSRATVAPSIDFDSPGSLEDRDASELTDRSTVEGARFTDADLSNVDLASITLLECEFVSPILTEAQLRGARFVDTAVTTSFAPVLRAARTSWKRCRIENPRWGSAELFEADLDSVLIVGGKIDFLNLRGAKLTNVRFENCTITELDLGGATAKRVSFVDCRIDILDMTRATCSDVDLRTSDFARITSMNGLRGATIDELQVSLFATALATELGIRIE